jgi:hypothetical protein
MFRSNPIMFGLLTVDLYDRLMDRNEISFDKLATYSHRKWRYVMVKRRGQEP